MTFTSSKIVFSIFIYQTTSICCDKIYFRNDYTLLNDLGAFYKLQTNKLNFSEAISACTDEHAELFMPRSVDEAKMVAKAFKHNQELDIWIGAHDLYVEGSFHTLDGTPLNNVYTLWEEGEPSNYLNSEDCVALGTMLTMNDIPCNEKREFVCKRNSAIDTQNPICETFDLDYQYRIDFDDCYKFHKTPKTWKDAIKTCHVEESRLLTIESDNEARMLTQKLKDFAFEQNTMIHMGFSDILVPGVYRTIGGRLVTELGYNTWSSGEPTVAGKCGAMIIGGAMLTTVDCNTRSMFFCEKALSRDHSNGIDIRSPVSSTKSPVTFQSNTRIVLLPDYK